MEKPKEINLIPKIRRAELKLVTIAVEKHIDILNQGEYVVLKDRDEHQLLLACLKYMKLNYSITGNLSMGLNEQNTVKIQLI